MTSPSKQSQVTLTSPTPPTTPSLKTEKAALQGVKHACRWHRPPHGLLNSCNEFKLLKPASEPLSTAISSQCFEAFVHTVAVQQICVTKRHLSREVLSRDGLYKKASVKSWPTTSSSVTSGLVPIPNIRAFIAYFHNMHCSVVIVLS